MDNFMFENPGHVQGGFIFNSMSDKQTTFVVQQNSSATRAVRGFWDNVYTRITVPMQVAAQKEIARQVRFPPFCVSRANLCTQQHFVSAIYAANRRKK
jgi:hypothetical protein